MAVHGASHSFSLCPSARLLQSPAPCSGQASPRSGAAAPGSQNDSIPGGRRERIEGEGEEEGGEKHRFAANDISGERERHDWTCTTMKQLSLKSHQFKLLHRASEKLDIT